MSTRTMLAVLALLPAIPLAGAELQPRTVAEYNEYIANVEKDWKSRTKAGDFLWVDDSAERLALVRGGDVVAQNWKGDEPISIHEGDVNDFIGAVFIKGKDLDDVLELMRDYGNYSAIYSPEVAESRILSENGGEYRVFLKYIKKFVLTIGYNTEHAIRYSKVDDNRWQSQARSTKVAELEGVGTPSEKELPAGKDNGFFWGMYSYYNFEQMDDGVIVECRAITLSAPLPASMRWMASTIQEIPRQSLANILESTRKALE